MSEESTTTLLLGPTNTGKTHRAIERMLEHRSGMIGLPLRLLAREVYDRISARLGEREVALSTGEEKRIPPRPRYWVCTVEAMPMEREVDFLAVDEIQLAAHRERGHVFTERLLRARGRLETHLLGADTIAPLARELLPEAELERQSRLSTLRYAGSTGLGGLPPRSAVVAFSAEAVYELAAKLRARRGGAAVVLGALSPRTRNAQVALFQAGEVQHIVATDAIGMGLNLALDHVAFASLRKFDGAEHRPLEPAELAQIAGRAGRHTRDGTFGTLRPCPELTPRAVEMIEAHRFGALRRLVWRNPDLDFGSLDALIASLAASPPSARFVRVERADDFDVLRALALRPAVRDRATDEARRRLLWEVCQVPEYQKLLLLRHVTLLERVFVELSDRARLDTDWMATEVRRLERTDGDIEDLTGRLAAIRVWSYLSHRGDWADDAAGWRERCRQVEDALGDALHTRLVERFVDGGARGRVSASSRVNAEGPFRELAALLAPEPEVGSRVDAIVEAPYEAFAIDDTGALRFEGELLARLVAGRSLTEPGLSLSLEGEAAGAAARIERRLVAFVRDWVGELLAPLRPEEDVGAPLRGLLYRLERGLGAARREDAAPQLEALSDEDRERLDELGVVIGRRHIYSRPLLRDAPMRRRALLVAIAGGEPAGPAEPSRPSAPRRRGLSADAYLARGAALLGPRAVRLDLLERTLEAAETLDEDALLRSLGRWLGVRRRERAAILSALRRREEPID